MKIHYLYNSGFAVETDQHLLVFDYYLDAVEQGEKCLANGAIGAVDLTVDKKILVFVSHKHPDHFNPVIFDWSKENPNIEYVISKDIKKTIECNGKLHRMKAYEKLELEGATIYSFGSTDCGISFLVQLDGQCIFHAGDLNWWHWNEDTEKENNMAVGRFKAEIKRIIENPETGNIDVAFFPVDKRQQQAFSLGAAWFVEKLKPKVLVPMHFREAFEATTEFASLMKDRGDSVYVPEIRKRGQEIVL